MKRDSSASAKCGMVLRVTGDEAVTGELGIDTSAQKCIIFGIVNLV